MFDSLDAFRAHCGEPTLPIERCPNCSAIPEHCYLEHVSSMVSDYDVDYGDEGRPRGTKPPEVDQLETFVEMPKHETLRHETLLRCPTCHRIYHHKYVLDLVGARNYSRDTYDRVDVETFFRSRACVSRRLADRKVAAVREPHFFPHHTIIRFPEARTWFSLDEKNHLVELGSEALPRLVASDPPTALEDVARARSYAELVGEVEDPDVRVVDSFEAIRWRESLTGEDHEQIDAVRAASRIAPPIAERVDDHVLVHSWVISRRRLICRVVTVRKTGEVLREDAVIGENLPVREAW